MINKVILLGNLGKDPEVKTLESGKKVASFSLATTESYKDKNGERQSNTEWHNISFFGSIVEVIEKYLKKGNQIYIEGKIKTRSWDDKDGVKRYTTDIIGDKLTMLGGGSKSSTGDSTAGSGTYTPPSTTTSDEDDLPF